MFYFFNPMGDTINALSLVIAIYAFITALLLFVAQTENYNRISHYWKKKGNRAWLVIFNSSRRHLIGEAMYKPLSIDHNGMTKVDPILTSGSVEKAHLDLDTQSDRFVLDFSYMAPKSAIIAEFKDVETQERPELHGVLKGGRLVKCYFWFDDIMHCLPVLLAGYAGFCVLVIGALLYLRSKGQITQGPFIVYSVGAIVLAVGVYWFFCRNRRIFVKEYNEVRKQMKRER